MAIHKNTVATFVRKQKLPADVADEINARAAEAAKDFQIADWFHSSKLEWVLGSAELVRKFEQVRESHRVMA